MDAVAIALAGGDVGEVGMPHMCSDFGKFDALFVVVLIYEAEFDFLSGFGKYGEVGSGSIEGGTEGGRGTRPHLAGMGCFGTGVSHGVQLSQFWGMRLTLNYRRR